MSGSPPAPVDLTDLFGPELAQTLKSLGADLPKPPPADEPLLISAVVPEPGLEITEALFSDQKPTLQRGLKILQKLFPGRKIMEVLPKNLSPLGENEVIRYKETFPLTLPSLVRRRVLGLAKPEADGIVGPAQLWALGSAARSGLPLTLIPITIQGFHYLAPQGLKLKNVLDAVNLKPMADDVVILGGQATGRPTARLERGLRASDQALTLIRRDKVAYQPGPCRLCGLCEKACPMNLPIRAISGKPMDSWHMHLPEAEKLLAGCAGCGACALACPAQRPLLLLALAAGASDPYGRRLAP
jgi:NAD-dependent dihydropyrimidine dehydrogenase PreA subunit